MGRSVRSLIAGFIGALEGLLALALGLLLIAGVTLGLMSVATHGEVGLGSFIPREQPLTSQAASLRIEGTPEAKMAIRQAFSSLIYPVDTSGFKIVVTDPKDLPADAQGLFVSPENIIYVSTRATGPFRPGLSHLLAHEIGHMIDATYLDQASRRQFMRMRGYAAGSDWAAPGALWEARPIEDFAEVYAVLDAPSSPSPIATDAGPLHDVARMRQFVRRSQPSKNAKVLPLRVAAQVSTVWNGADPLSSDPLMLILGCCTVLVAMVVGANHSMRCAARSVRS